MSKKKALSAEEKRIKLLELFHETSDVFQLKDLERLAPKEKGIVMQSVKVTLQELVDNGQVFSEKIAGSIYFWAFSSAALDATKRLLLESEEFEAQLQNKIDNGQKRLETINDSMENAAEAASMQRQIEMLQKEKKELEKLTAAAGKEVDYDDIAAKQQDAKKILEAANRWTDNIFSTKMWVKRKFDKDDRELDKAFGIPEDLDYLNA